MCEDVRSRERIKNCSGLEQTKKKGVGRVLEIILSQKGKKKTLLGQLGKSGAHGLDGDNIISAVDSVAGKCVRWQGSTWYYSCNCSGRLKLFKKRCPKLLKFIL